jgi:tRNA 2-thiouridine synthesizing protein A
MGENHAERNVVDARGLACPLPVLKLRKALKLAAPGSVWVLLATDMVAARDVPAFCRAAGHEVLKHTRDAAGLRFEIRAGAPR